MQFSRIFKGPITTVLFIHHTIELKMSSLTKMNSLTKWSRHLPQKLLSSDLLSYNSLHSSLISTVGQQLIFRDGYAGLHGKSALVIDYRFNGMPPSSSIGTQQHSLSDTFTFSSERTVREAPTCLLSNSVPSVWSALTQSTII